jgi:hypothetical protein
MEDRNSQFGTIQRMRRQTSKISEKMSKMTESHKSMTHSNSNKPSIEIDLKKGRLFLINIL